MHINLEATDQHSIQAYSDNEIKIGSIVYQSNLIVSSHEIISDWSIQTIQQLNDDLLEPLLRYRPTIVIIGHRRQGQFAPIDIMQKLSKQGIGLETMSIGAACRTFNVLLSEQRDVVLGLIL